MKSTKKVVKWVFSNKWLGIFVVLALASVGYWFFSFYSQAEEMVGYTTEKVKKGELVVSLSGNGQVSASNQTEVKFKAGGEITYVGVTNGQTIKQGALIARLDTTEVQKDIRDAEINLESAQLSLEKILKPASALEILQAKNNLVQAQETKLNAEGDLEEAYEEAFNSVSDAFLDLPTVVIGLQDILFSDDLSGNSQWNVSYYGDVISDYNENSQAMSDLAYETYLLAKNSYDDNFDAYKATNRSSEKKVLEDLVTETYNTTRDLSDAIKNINNLIQLYQDEYSERGLTIKTLSNTQLSSLNSYTGTINNVLSDLLNAKNEIKNIEEEILNADRSIAEQEGSYAELLAGADEYEIRSAQISVSQKENSLADMQNNLSDYSVYAPFAGVVAGVEVKKGEEVSAGTVAITLITKQNIAEIVLNEIEIAEVKVGQKVNLKFDAADDLALVGEVAEVDTLGTVSSGVVSYGVKISFNSSDERIKPGMSVNAEIIIAEKTDVLIVSNVAVTYVEEKTFVQKLDKGQPRRQEVTIGMITDLNSEILTGLTEGEEIIVGKNVVDTGSKTSTTNSNNGVKMGEPSADMQMMRMMR